MSKRRLLFKRWVPEWMIKIILFIVLLPSLVLFFLPLANVNAAAGNLGIETYDVYFCVVLFYAGYTSFFSLERRFYNFLAAKEYFIIITLIQIATSYVCYLTQEVAVLFVCRFIQGMAFTMTVNLSLSLIFNRLHSKRARTIGYSIFFGMLISMIPFNNFATAELIDSFDFNLLYKWAMFSYAPSLITLSICMNNNRLTDKFHLEKLDWASFVLYATTLVLIGYICVYGQEYYWLEDPRIYLSVISIFFIGLLFILRQKYMENPYFNLSVFKSPNFIIGLVIILVFYLCRFTLGIATNYFQNVLKLDPIHVGYLTLFNIIGIIIGVVLACAYVLQNRPIRILWIYGFMLLLIYHAWMFFLFNSQANENIFYVPLVLHGMGVGLLMSPTIIYVIVSVKEEVSPTAAGVCLLFRCLGFYLSVALINYFDLFSKSKHYNTFQQQLTSFNPIVKQVIAKQSSAIIHHGASSVQASKLPNQIIVKAIQSQGHIRFAMDYYEMISWMIFFTILLVAMFPYLNKTFVKVKKSLPAPF